MITRPVSASEIAARNPAIPLPITRKSATMLTLVSYQCTMPNAQGSMTSAGTRVDVTAGSRPSTIWIGNGLSARLPELLEAHGVGARRFVVSSPAIWRLHGARLQETLGRVEPILLPD